MSNRRVIFAALLLFISGAALGAVCARAYDGSHGHHYRHGDMVKVVMQRLDRELNLTDEQQRELTPIVTEMHEQFLAYRRETRPRVEALLDGAVQKALPLLQPEQQQKLRDLEARIKAHFEHEGHGKEQK